MRNYSNSVTKETLESVYEITTKKSAMDMEFQIISAWVYNGDVINEIKKELGFKSIGSTASYPDVFEQPESIDAYDLLVDIDKFEQLAYSRKFKCVMHYSISTYSMKIVFLLPFSKIRKFAKVVKPLLTKDGEENPFRNVEFTAEAGVYYEAKDMSDRPRTEEMKESQPAVRCVVDPENLVFDKDSTIYQVLEDINNFFSAKTKKLYNSISIPHKRGVILHGNPGNGKSAMIREIIRSHKDIIKVVINPGVKDVTGILSALIKELNGKQSVIIIEDIDSLITDYNRSDFLNILDGVAGRSGMYFIGTTNYPERIDPAFMNRAGRFDRKFEINDPSHQTRLGYFKHIRIDKLVSEFVMFKDTNNTQWTKESVYELFANNSEGLAMASLKEVTTATLYLLATSDNNLTVEEAVETVYKQLAGDKAEHGAMHDKYNAVDDNQDRPRRGRNRLQSLQTR